MKVAILLYGMFRHPDTAQFWSYMLPKGDVFVCATFTKNPNTQRSDDKGPVFANITFNGIDRATVWSVHDQQAFDSSIGLERMIAGKKDTFSSNANRASLKNAVRAIFQLQTLKDMFLAHGKSHTHAVLSRVDLLFVRPVNVNSFEHDVVVSNYASFGGYNDRFAAGPIDKVLLLMDRKDVWNRTNSLAERLMAATCRARSIKPRLLPVGYNRRVRVGGVLHATQYTHRYTCPLDTAQKMTELLPYATTVRRCITSH